ncbi:MAG TPA: hypothetical protein VH186_30170 [Chloroflexia bacterium]|nr:hypothetical protein [Chloroflexia bacterium]
MIKRLKLPFKKFDHEDIGRKVQVMTLDCKLLSLAEDGSFEIEFDSLYLARMNDKTRSLFEEVMKDYEITPAGDNNSLDTDDEVYDLLLQRLQYLGPLDIF